MTLEDAAFKLLLGADAKVLGEGWARPLHEEFKRLGVESANVTGAIAIIGTPGTTPPDGKVTQAGIDRHLTCLKLITPAILQGWRTANRFPVDDLVLVNLLVAHDPLFAAPDAMETRSQRELKRFDSIPADVVSAWSGAAGEPEVDAAFELLRTATLFTADTFSKSRFDSALPVAKRLLAEREKQ